MPVPKMQMNPHRRHCQFHWPLLAISLASGVAVCSVSIWAWSSGQRALPSFSIALFGLCLVLGFGAYAVLPRKTKPLARKLALVLGGASGLLFSLSSRNSLDLEGLLFLLLAAAMGAAIVHHLITVFVGPMIFGRVWCAWGCWTAMVLDLLPFSRSAGRRGGMWRVLPLWALALTVGVVALARHGFGYRGVATVHSPSHPAELYWILAVNILYYGAGGTMAFYLKDNRAFCKYVCPTAVLLRLTSRFSAVRIAGRKDTCDDCGACTRMCPMDIRISDYVRRGERVLSTECILCRTCISVCPSDTLRFSFAFDTGDQGRLVARSPGAKDV